MLSKVLLTICDRTIVSQLEKVKKKTEIKRNENMTETCSLKINTLFATVFVRLRIPVAEIDRTTASFFDVLERLT